MLRKQKKKKRFNCDWLSSLSVQLIVDVSSFSRRSQKRKMICHYVLGETDIIARLRDNDALVGDSERSCIR